MRFAFSALLALLSVYFNVSALSAASAYPYGNPVNYAYGAKPTTFFTGTWSGDSSALYTKWTNWKAANVTSNGAGGNLRVQRPQNGNDTVSEGISYGMILAVYFDDQATFNALWLYKQAHNDGLGLMNWDIASSGSTASGGNNSATDADQDIAYALYLAGYQWGNGGTYNYKSLADAEVLKVKNYDLDSSMHLKPGDSFDSCRYPSYFFPNEYRVFGKQTNDSGTWDLVRNNVYATIASSARNATTGLMAEECTDTGQGGGCGVSSTQYLYNSCRVPYRMALDYVYYGDSNAQAELGLLSGGFFAGIWPTSLGDGYNLNGTQTSANNNAAFEGPGACSFMVAGGSNLNNYYTTLMGYSDTTYYSGAIQLLTLLLLQGQMPNIADPAAIYTATVTPTQTNYAGTPTFTATPTPIAFGYIFEDFETGSLKVGYTYPGTKGSTASQVISTATANSGTDSDAITVNVVATDYAGAGFNSNYANANGVVDATGSNAIRLAFKGDPSNTLKFVLQVKEAGTPSAKVAGGDGEVWDSPMIIVPAGSGWTTQVIPLAGWTKDAYSGTQAGGDGIMNLSAMQTVQFNFNVSPMTGTFYVDDIAFVPSVAPTPTATPTPFNNPYAQLYDDFEAPLSLSQPARAATYADTANGASASWSLDSTTVADGLHSAKLTYNTGSAAAYGCGGYDISPYGTPQLYVDASGAVQLAFWIDAPAGLKYSMEFQEAGTPSSPTAGGADGEAWLSPIQTAQSGWQYVVLDIGKFSEDPYNPICNPTGLAAPGPCLSGAMAGNNHMDLQAISSVTIKLNGNQGSGALYLDDLDFITIWKTSTPTLSPSPSASPTRSPSPTASPTPTPSPSVSPSPSPSASPSASPSPSPTASPTPQGSATDSPTLTPYAGSPTDSPSASPSPSDTVTASPSDTPAPGSPTASPTATPTASPSPSPASASPTASPSASPTLSATLTSTAPPSPSPSQTPGGPTATATPSITPGGPANTATVTPPGGSSGGLILELHAMPVPWTPASAGPLRVLALLAKDAQGLDLKVYSEAMVRVGTVHLGAVSRGWQSLELPTGLPSGLYYFEVSGTYQGHIVPSAKTGKLVILR